ncbi:MAG TPA: hypothetical protein VGN07_13775 [Steroidobacteraceae bacterium]|jgi:plastocyanin
MSSQSTSASATARRAALIRPMVICPIVTRPTVTCPVGICRVAICLIVTCVMAAMTPAATRAATLTVSVLDPHGQAVPGTVVVAVPQHVAAPASRAASAVMDQLNKAFVPEVLVIRSGTSVVFPNSDAVSHQVYSFSPAKRFELPLYRGQPNAPILFDQPGVVVLGCNIHDTMTGYIYVTDSPWFGTADEKGQWHVASLPAGDYRITIWNPHFAREEQSVEQSLSLGAEQTAAIRFQLRQTIRRAPKTADARIRDY